MNASIPQTLSAPQPVSAAAASIHHGPGLDPKEQAPAATGYYVNPTVVTDVRPDMEVAREHGRVEIGLHGLLNRR